MVPLKVNDNEDIHQETHVSIASLKNVSFRGLEASGLPIPLRYALFYIALVDFM